MEGAVIPGGGRNGGVCVALMVSELEEHEDQASLQLSALFIQGFAGDDALGQVKTLVPSHCPALGQEVCWGPPGAPTASSPNAGSLKRAQVSQQAPAGYTVGKTRLIY